MQMRSAMIARPLQLCCQHRAAGKHLIPPRGEEGGGGWELIKGEVFNTNTHNNKLMFIYYTYIM